MDTDSLLEAYERMLMIRQFEEAAANLYRDGEIPGFLHLSVGQEGSAVGACWPLGNEDIITSTHRGHGHCLAKGLEPGPMMAELMGREGGTNHGLGGSMHIADPSKGIFGANGIVGAGLPIAVGAATASWLEGRRRVTVCFFGDGAPSQGAFHEAVNLAALWRLPIVFFCENNQYAEFASSSDQQPVSLETRARGYGIDYLSLNGNDVIEVVTSMSRAVGGVREGGGPVIIEAHTYRWHGHYEGDPQRYRSVEELEDWKRDRDPIQLARHELLQRGVPEARLNETIEHVQRIIDDAVEYGRSSPPPSESRALSSLYAPFQVETRPENEPHSTDTFKTMDAVREALECELESDQGVFLAGVDVGRGGNVFGITRGLYERWPDRVLDTPISETAIMGIAVGSAMSGMRPVVELMYLDFIGVCFDQILNQAAKLRFHDRR